MNHEPPGTPRFYRALFWRELVSGHEIVKLGYDEIGLAQIELSSGEQFYFHPLRGQQPSGTLVIREFDD